MRVLTDKQQEAEHEVTCASAELDHTRDQFVASMGALEHEITRALDWREWVRRRVGIALALSFGLGLLLGRRP